MSNGRKEWSERRSVFSADDDESAENISDEHAYDSRVREPATAV